MGIKERHYKGFSGWKAEQLAARGATSQPVQGHLRLFAARPRPTSSAEHDPVLNALYKPNPLPEVLPAEQAYLAIEADDLKLTAVGGLE